MIAIDANELVIMAQLALAVFLSLLVIMLNNCPFSIFPAKSFSPEIYLSIQCWPTIDTTHCLVYM